MTAADDIVCFDPHVHTGVSHDAVGSVDQILAAARQANLDAVAITDHDTMSAIPEALVKAEEYGLTVVPGVEISTADGHLIALGVTDHPPVGIPAEDTVDWIHERRGVAIVPHPFQRSRHGIQKRDMPDNDGIEVLNAWSMTGIQNGRARLYASRAGSARVGGSDAHDPRMVGRACTELDVKLSDQPIDVTAVLDTIRAGDTEVCGSTASAIEYVGKYTRSLGIKTRNTVSRAVFNAD